MDIYERFEQIEKGCRGIHGIQTRRSYRMAGLFLLASLRGEFPGIRFKPAEMQWDSQGHFISTQDEASLVVLVDRAAGVVLFTLPTDSGSMKDYVFQKLVDKYADFGIQENLARCTPAMRRTLINILK